MEKDGTEKLLMASGRVMDWLKGPAGVVASKTFAELLVRVRFSFAGAEALRETDSPSTCKFCPRFVEILMFIVGAAPTFTGAVAVVIPADVADTVAEPCATPVTGTVIESCPAGITAVAGTVTKFVLSLERLKVTPFGCGAGAEIFSAMLLVRVAGMESEVGLNEAVTVTCTGAVSGANPVADAVMTVVPIATPVTWGLAAGTCCP